eukprot:gene3472-13533_t
MLFGQQVGNQPPAGSSTGFGFGSVAPGNNGNANAPFQSAAPAFGTASNQRTVFGQSVPAGGAPQQSKMLFGVSVAPKTSQAPDGGVVATRPWMMDPVVITKETALRLRELYLAGAAGEKGKHYAAQLYLGSLQRNLTAADQSGNPGQVSPSPGQRGDAAAAAAAGMDDDDKDNQRIAVDLEAQGKGASARGSLVVDLEAQGKGASARGSLVVQQQGWMKTTKTTRETQFATIHPSSGNTLLHFTPFGRHLTAAGRSGSLGQLGGAAAGMDEDDEDHQRNAVYYDSPLFGRHLPAAGRSKSPGRVSLSPGPRSGAAAGMDGDDGEHQRNARSSRFKTSTPATFIPPPPPAAANSMDMGNDDNSHPSAATPQKSPQRWASPARTPTQAAPSPSPAPSSTPARLRPAYQYSTGGGMDDDDDIDLRDAESDLRDSGKVVGTSDEMCPAAERNRREECGELNYFERVDPKDFKRTSPLLCVKKSVRNYEPDVLEDPKNFRTFNAIARTVNHLHTIMDRTDCDLLDIHAFLWDRFREGHLNQEQMNKQLLDLMDYYVRAAALGLPTPNSAEIKCYLVIMTYGGLENKTKKKHPNKLGALGIIRRMTPAEQESPWYSLMLAIVHSMMDWNPYTYFSIASRAPYILACVMANHMAGMRKHALGMLATAYVHIILLCVMADHMAGMRKHALGMLATANGQFIECLLLTACYGKAIERLLLQPLLVVYIILLCVMADHLAGMQRHELGMLATANGQFIECLLLTACYGQAIERLLL